MRISDWSSDVCSSDLAREVADDRLGPKSDAWYLIIRWESPRPLSPAILDHAPDFRLHRQCQRAADRPLQREAAAAEGDAVEPRVAGRRSEEHTSELPSLMRTSYAVSCLKRTNQNSKSTGNTNTIESDSQP